MNNAIIFCLCLHGKLLNEVKQLDYITVGLGKDNFSNDWLRDFYQGKKFIKSGGKFIIHTRYPRII